MGLPFEQQPTESAKAFAAFSVHLIVGLERSLVQDALKVEADEEGVGGDDAADACRYLVATKARSLAQGKFSGL